MQKHQTGRITPYRPAGRGIKVSRPLERVEIDEIRIDPITVMARAGMSPPFSEEELEAKGLNDRDARWWMAMAIDRRTRIILGMTVTKAPKASSATGCLRMIVSDKSGISDAAGAAAKWNQYGSPELLVADNGPGFKSVGFTEACEDLGIPIERTIAGAPSMRGSIERMFSICAALPRLDGRAFPNVVERGDHPSGDRACHAADDLAFALVRWIVDVYHDTPHVGLGGRTPLRQWQEDHASGNFRRYSFQPEWREPSARQ